MLVLSVPHLDSNVKTLSLGSGDVHNAHVDGHMAQVLGNSSSWTGDSYLSGFNSDLDCRYALAEAFYLPPSGTAIKSSLRMTLMLLISYFINK